MHRHIYKGFEGIGGWSRKKIWPWGGTLLGDTLTGLYCVGAQEGPSHRNLSRGSYRLVPQKWRRAGELPREGAYVSRWQHVRELQKGSSGLGSLWPGLNLSIARGEVLWVCKESRLQMAKKSACLSSFKNNWMCKYFSLDQVAFEQMGCSLQWRNK